jgi:diaminopimelate decarboxylase
MERTIKSIAPRIRALESELRRPFYLYDREGIRRNCRLFKSIPYPRTKTHFASMANINREFLQILREEGLGIFVNSMGHLKLAEEVGFLAEEIVFTASAMDETTLRQVHGAGAELNLDSQGQLDVWWGMFPGAPVGLRCNIGELVEPRPTRAGYFLGRESRLGLTVAEIERLAGSPSIAGLHLYLGTDLVDLDYFEECYGHIARLARLFPELRYLDFGGGFGVPAAEGGRPFDFARYGRFVTALMEEVSKNAGRPVRLVLEPGRIIGCDAGYFVCRVTDVKLRGGRQLVGVNGSSAQFPRPLFYPDSAVHPVAILPQSERTNGHEYHTDLYGCSTYSRDYLARDVALPEVRLGDLAILGNAGSYCASAVTAFLGFPSPAEVFL